MPLRIGLIGTTGHTGFVLGGISRVEDAVFAAAAPGHEGESLDALRKSPAFSAETVIHDDYRRMLDRAKLDVVGVCRPYPMNAQAVIDAAERGVHVICEKPVATTLEDLDRLEAAVAKAGIRLTAMFGMRLEPSFQAARKAVAEGLVGEPLLATGQKSYRFGTRPGFFRNRETYGGTIPWVAIHAVDYVRWSVGLEYTQVAALHGNGAHPDYPGCEDHGGILFRLSNGGTAMVNLDYLRPAAAPTHGDDRLRIAGSRGVVEVVDCGARTVLITEGAGPRDLPLEPQRDFLTDFVAELRGQGTHIVGPGEAVRVTRICLLAREAADTGRVLAIPSWAAAPSAPEGRQ